MKKQKRPSKVKRKGKTSIINIRFEPDEKEDLIARMEASGMTTSDYIRQLIALDKREGYICKY